MVSLYRFFKSGNIILLLWSLINWHFWLHIIQLTEKFVGHFTRNIIPAFETECDVIVLEQRMDVILYHKAVTRSGMTET